MYAFTELCEWLHRSCSVRSLCDKISFPDDRLTMMCAPASEWYDETGIGDVRSSPTSTEKDASPDSKIWLGEIIQLKPA